MEVRRAERRGRTLPVVTGDVELGIGALNGVGVVAARDFVAGETVLTYALVPLSAQEYADLLPQDTLFVHSFYGRRFLYPEPARYVNHSETPSCTEDFTAGAYIARHGIRAGDPVTINNQEETRYELVTFLLALNDALGPDGDLKSLERLLRPDAQAWIDNTVTIGFHAVAAALRQRGLTVEVSTPSWHLGTGRWEALCSTQVSLTGLTSQRVVSHASLLLGMIDQNWQLTYLHVG